MLLLLFLVSILTQTSQIYDLLSVVTAGTVCVSIVEDQYVAAIFSHEFESISDWLCYIFADNSSIKFCC